MSAVLTKIQQIEAKDNLKYRHSFSFLGAKRAVLVSKLQGASCGKSRLPKSEKMIGPQSLANWTFGSVAAIRVIWGY